ISLDRTSIKMRKKECRNSNFALFWESFYFLNSFIEQKVTVMQSATKHFAHSAQGLIYCCKKDTAACMAFNYG
ncbi:hypothetical protein, partial [Hymenobacter lapidarius]|uniref:hypothetical protein n=1 Tax=Hymenobacter lapidarius TaxID=1908237 RepID=UPI00195DA21C